MQYLIYDDEPVAIDPQAFVPPATIIEPQPQQPAAQVPVVSDTIRGVPRRFYQPGYYSLRD